MSNTKCRPMPERAPRCRHNLNYWTFGDYLGIGAGRARQDHACERRENRAHDATTAAARVPDTMPTRGNRGGIDVLSKDLAFEFMLNALRLVEGFEMQ